MKMHYNKKDDILFIEFSNAAVKRDISYGWNVNVGMTETGIGQITILDATSDGLLPIELDDDLYGMIHHQYHAKKAEIKHT